MLRAEALYKGRCQGLKPSTKEDALSGQRVRVKVYSF
jgi:hypothetical protein